MRAYNGLALGNICISRNLLSECGEVVARSPGTEGGWQPPSPEFDSSRVLNEQDDSIEGNKWHRRAE